MRRARLREGSTQTHAVLRGINSLLPVRSLVITPAAGTRLLALFRHTLPSYHPHASQVRLLALFTHAELELMT